MGGEMGLVNDEIRAIAEADRERVQHGYEEVREPFTNRLLFEISPERSLIRIRQRKTLTIIDLAQYGLVYREEMDGGFA